MSCINKKWSLFVRLLPQYRMSSTNNDISPMLTNRNPRNLEKLRVGYKPDGYHLERPGKRFWHKLQVTETGRHVLASVVHFENGPVVQASTQEWAIKKFLYKNTDTSAYINLGRVLAKRCLECGLTEIQCFLEPPNKEGKLALFLKAFEDGGVSLSEPAQFKPHRPWDQYRPEKPWDVIE